MPTFKPGETDYLRIKVHGKPLMVLSHEALAQFDLELLGLGDLTQTANPCDAIAAVFDLEGFTNFCKQIEPHLSVPVFLQEFLTWLMGEIKKQTIRKKHRAGVALWSPLPFFVKFMGDGLLVLWDASNMGEVTKRNVIVTASDICDCYKTDFFGTIRGKVVEPPPVLRCGIARGTVYSVGDGNDYVGSCINMSVRLSRLPGVTFAFNRRGFNLEEARDVEFFNAGVIIRHVSIRGIGENELIGIRMEEFKSLTAEDRKRFRPL
jgi:class 3 adenylate cyclase